MKEIVFSMICMACGPAEAPRQSANEDPNLYPRYSYNEWVSSHHDSVPPKILEMIDVLHSKADTDYPKAAAKMVEALDKIQYIIESPSFPTKADGTRTMGTCYTQGGRPLGIDILTREGFDVFNKEFYGVYATEITLDGIREFVIAHELGHCLGGLGHSTAHGVLIMSAYVNWQSVSKYMSDKDLYITDLVSAIERGSAGLWNDEVPDMIDIDEED